MNSFTFSAIPFLLGLQAVSGADVPKVKPTSQYEADGIAVPLASADEPLAFCDALPAP